MKKKNPNGDNGKSRVNMMQAVMLVILGSMLTAVFVAFQAKAEAGIAKTTAESAAEDSSANRQELSAIRQEVNARLKVIEGDIKTLLQR